MRDAQVFETQLMQNLCKYIQAHCAERLTLKQLSAQAHLSSSHLQRRFKAAIGVSPKEYTESCRLAQLKAGLRTKTTVTQAMYDAGFSAPSRLYERIDTRLGMTPKQYRAAGAALIISYASMRTVLGLVMIGATDRGICCVQFGNKKNVLLKQLQTEFKNATLQPMPAVHRKQFNQWAKNLAQYLAGEIKILSLPLDIRGTAFQLKVWKYLQTIPAGNAQSYKEVAIGIGQPKAARAVANACASNHVAIAIPCHRVLRGNGDLGGFRWGIKRKRALLDLEQSKLVKK